MACDDNTAADAISSTSASSGVPTAALISEPVTASASPAPTPSAFSLGDSVLTVAIQDPATLDPMRLADPAAELVARQLFEGLTRWDPVAQKVKPAAATSWDATDGGRTFTFHLRPGMTFHNGQPVTSEDFAFAFDRIATKSNASDLAYTLQNVEGFQATNVEGTSAHLSGISTPDDLTLKIKLSRPYRDFPIVLTHPGLVPLLKSEVENTTTFLSAPVGNGPFQIAQPWHPGEPILMRSFTAFTPTPKLDGLRFLPYQDPSSSWLPFLNGAIDIAEVPSDQIKVAGQQFGEAGYQPFLAGYYYGLNLNSPQLKKLDFRKAISRAIDRPTIAAKIYKGTLVPPRGIVPQGMPGFQENQCFKLCDYSPAAARRLLKHIPKKKRKVSLSYTQGNPHGQVARAVSKDLEAVGIKVSVTAYPFPKYLKRLKDGKQSMYRLGWIAEYPDPGAFLDSLFASTSPDNHSGFASAKVDRILSQAAAERNGAVRIQDYKKAEQLILKQVPIVPIGSFMTHLAAQKWVRGIQFDQTGGFDAGSISIAEH
ncbi:MAG: oligopeptide transport system substrate-binding protein [Actinomycetota bacterium]|nr:oligopeptide transport system substrate-binding protein [Actinomycetota bacterium]